MVSRSGARMTESRSDVYGYNDRNELVSAGRDALVASAPEYEYFYDDIGNRLSSIEVGTGNGEQGTGGISSRVTAYPKTDPRVFCPKGTCVVAYYHTHPSSPNFSKNDKRYIQGGTVSYYMSNGDVLKRIDPQREKGVDDLKGGELALPNGEYAISPRVVDLKIESEE